MVGKNISRLFTFCAEVFFYRQKSQHVFNKPVSAHLKMERRTTFCAVIRLSWFGVVLLIVHNWYIEAAKVQHTNKKTPFYMINRLISQEVRSFRLII
jgi:hypothetical protein